MAARAAVASDPAMLGMTAAGMRMPWMASQVSPAYHRMASAMWQEHSALCGPHCAMALAGILKGMPDARTWSGGEVAWKND